MIDKKYQAKIIANDQEGLALISACMSGSRVKVSDMKYLPSIQNDKNSKPDGHSSISVL